MIYKEIYKLQKLEEAYKQQKESRESIKKGLKEKELRMVYRWSTMLSLHKESPREGPLRFKLWNLDMQVQGLSKAIQRVCKMKPNGMHKQAHCIDKFESEKHILKTMSWAKAQTSMQWGIK